MLKNCGFPAVGAGRRRINGRSGLSSQASIEQILRDADRNLWLIDAAFLAVGIVIGVML